MIASCFSVKPDFGSRNAAYYNDALADELVPFLSFDHTPEAEAAREAASVLRGQLGGIDPEHRCKLPDDL